MDEPHLQIRTPMPEFLNFGIMNYCHLTEVSVRFSHYVAVKEMYHQNVEMKHYLRITFVNGHFKLSFKAVTVGFSLSYNAFLSHYVLLPTEALTLVYFIWGKILTK